MAYYNKRQLCVIHRQHGEIAAICERCYSSALTQQRKQHEAERLLAHERYLTSLLALAA